MTEAQYSVHVVCKPEAVSDVRDLLDAELDIAQYPVRDVETVSDTADHVELAAVLVPTSAKAEELDAVVNALLKSHLVQSATWTVSATH
jgi:putative Mg2+ transporter-C (MgtC) family protein